MLERRIIAVEGTVQGVGFRPYVHRLAQAHFLRGYVRNDSTGVLIDVEGDTCGVDEFCRLLPLTPPPLATITNLRVAAGIPVDYDVFRIAPSEASPLDRETGRFPPDVATCDACLRELFDPQNRRFGHAFITCTECGPRFTVVRSIPYDRARTSMAAFPLCGACEREYAAPSDRRFHAESISCPDCGPSLSLFRYGSSSPQLSGRNALDAATAALSAGGIVAIKALGGFHLACYATSEQAVERLRARKGRPAKPFAVMVCDEHAAAALCELSSIERSALRSAARPVVLAPRAAHADIAPAVAPGMQTIGLMLPSTPVHHLLLRAVGHPLVMTSGNRDGEPVVIHDQAVAALGEIADVFLTHNREIVARCDDSVVHVVAGRERQIRRSRGYVPDAIAWPFSVPETVLAVGGHLKNTVCVAHGASVHLSAHVGDLDSAAARTAFRAALDNTVRFGGSPATVVAHDLHPEYVSTLLALSYAAEMGIERRVPVQHHHAHIGACLAEHGVTGPAIGVVFDGAGLGTDGAIWGGEFLLVDGSRFERCGHLAYVPLPGGDAVARQPWRSAVTHLSRANHDIRAPGAWHAPDVADAEWDLVGQLVKHEGSASRTSSVGRLFDAVASLLGLCQVASFEGQAAMMLEAAAEGRSDSRYEVHLDGDAGFSVNSAWIINGVMHDIARGRASSDIAAAFHGALRDMIVLGCRRIRDVRGVETVALTGGVFMNTLLAESANAALDARGFRVLLPRLVPCNDGGLSFGQAYVAACALQEEACA